MICVKNDDDLNDDTASSTSSSSCSSDAALFDILGLSGLSSVIGGGGGISMTMAEEEEEEEEEVVELEEEIHVEKNYDAPLPPPAVRSDISSSSSNTLPHHPVSPIPQARRIQLPNSKGVSRKYYNPEDCFAFEISNILTKEECLQLINVAANSSSSNSSNSSSTNSSSSRTNSSSSDNDSFQYITHAMHTSPDGETKFEVELERPNPHKLAVFHSNTIVEDLLWKRLQPIILSSSLDVDAEAVQQDDNNNDENNEVNDTTHCLSNGMKQFIERESISTPIGLNPRLRVLKYDAGDNDEFKPHFDATTEISGDNQGTSSSYITVLLYLNDGDGKDFNGGETEFLSKEDDEIYNTGRTVASTTSSATIKECCKIIPKAGSVVLFEHDLYHRGCALTTFGTKYVLRTDILFENKNSNTDTNTNNNNTREDDDNDDNEKSNDVSTVEDVLCQMIQMIQMQEQEQQQQQHQQHSHQLTTTTTTTTTVQIQMIEELRNALSYGLGFGIDLNDTSIQCLCSPGRYVLQIMLHEHMTAINSSKNNSHNDSDNDNDNNKYVLQQVKKQKQQTKLTDQFLNISFNALKQQQ